MQQTYTDAFQDFERFVPRGDESFTAWLTSLARCNLIDALRLLDADKRGKDRQRIEPRSRADSSVALCEQLGVSLTTPSKQVAREEACRALEWALEQLPETYRKIVEMYDLEGRPVDEVAGELNLSPGAMYMRRARAHRSLREIMGSTSQYFSKR